MHSEIFCHIDTRPGSNTARGALVGKRAAVQACISVQGWPTEAGSAALRGFVAVEDATVVERLRDAGASLVGNTRSSELGFGLHGDGAGKAVAGGHVDLVLMTDTMGEARAAAASAGVFGFKPSYGQVSRFGLVGLVPSMDCCGILAKRFEDIGDVFTAIRGGDDRDPSLPDPAPPSSSPSAVPGRRPVSAGVVAQCLQGLSSIERAAFGAALSNLERAGIAVREIPFDKYELFPVVHNVIGSVEASSSCGKFDGVRYGHRAAGSRNWNEMYLRSRAESFGLPLKAYLFQGACFQFEQYAVFEKACRIRSELVGQSRRLHGEVDVLVSPARRAASDFGRANTVGQLYEAFSLTLPANVTGQPVLTLPGLVPCEGGDLGLQFLGAPFGDELLLGIAGRILQELEGTG